MIEHNTLVDILKMEAETGYLIIKKIYSEEVLFKLASPTMGIANGNIFISHSGQITLKIESFGHWKEIEWNKISIRSSILGSDVLASNVRYVCSSEHFNRFAMNFINLGVRTVCGCRHGKTINDRIVAVDVSYPNISRLRGCVVVRECEDIDCACWKVSCHTLSTRSLLGEEAIWDYIKNWSVDNKVKIPALDSVLLDFDIGYAGKEKRYSSQKLIDRKKNKISSMKGMSLEQIRKEYYK